MRLAPLLTLLLLTPSFATSDADADGIILKYDTERQNLVPDAGDPSKNLASFLKGAEAFAKAARDLGELFVNSSLGGCTTIGNESECFLRDDQNANGTLKRLQRAFGDTAVELFDDIKTAGISVNKNRKFVTEFLEHAKGLIMNVTDYPGLPKNMSESLEPFVVENLLTGLGKPIPAWSLCEKSLKKSGSKLVLSILYDLAGPGCKGIHFEPIPRNTIDNIYDYAVRRGFHGGKQAGCLLGFLLSVTSGNDALHSSFTNNVAKYLREQLFVFGFCGPILEYNDNVTEASNDTETALQQVKAIAQKLLHVANNTDDLRFVSVTIEGAFGTAAHRSRFAYPNPGDGKSQYEGTAEGLKNRTNAWNESEYYETIVYWPATGYSEHCVLNYTANMSFAFHTENDRNVNYVVTWHDRQDERRIRVLNKRFDDVDQPRVKELYRKTKKSNLCDRVEDGVNNPMGKRLISYDTFHTLVVVKCAKMFVWYQLSYQYYQAAYTTSPYKIEIEGGKYDSDCAMIALFP